MTEVVEQDTDVSEDIPNLSVFLKQDSPDDKDCAQVGYFYNRKVFDGWVKQPSACCGASSVAGAWNTLGSIHRKNLKAINHTHVLTAYQSMFIDLIARGRSSFERKLGAPIEGLLLEIENELAQNGRSIGGKKGANASKVAVLSALKKIARARLRSPAKKSDGDGGKEEKDNSGELSSTCSGLTLADSDRMPDAVDCIIDLFALDGVLLDKTDESKDAHDAKDIGPEEKSAVESGKKAESKGEGEDEVSFIHTAC
jgi:hypothetical protein